MKFEDALGFVFFSATVAAYVILVGLGRKWRREFEARGIKYWAAPKHERMEQLLSDVWRPRLVTLFYGLAYFANGYTKISFSLWAPLFLLSVRGLSIFEVALFIPLAYVSWQWKMFIGMLTDGVSIRFRNNAYRRHPWFVAAGTLGATAALGFVLLDPVAMPVWTVFFPLVLAMTMAGAFFDIATDSYTLDVTPPEWHARILGSTNMVGMAIGGATASMLGPLLISWGGYRLVFISGGLVALLAFFFVYLKEPRVEHERAFTKQAIAFTFTEKAVLIAALVMALFSAGIRKVSDPTAGVFSLTMREIVGQLSPTQAGNITLLTFLAGIPGSLFGGWAADRWGHKNACIVFGFLMAGTGYLWMTLTRGSVFWFMTLAALSYFIERTNQASVYALMGDTTPLALSGTVFQMYMSMSWIGNTVASIIVGTLLPTSIPLLFAILSTITIVPVIAVRKLAAYEVGKATTLDRKARR